MVVVVAVVVVGVVVAVVVVGVFACFLFDLNTVSFASPGAVEKTSAFVVVVV